MSERGQTRRWRHLIFAAILTCSAGAAATVLSPAPAAAQEQCDVTAHPTWTQTERRAWRDLCIGDWADLSRNGTTPDPRDAGGWNKDHALSSRFVQQLLEDPYADKLHRHGIRLAGAWLPKGINLNEARIAFGLRCIQCRIESLEASGARINGPLDLRASTINGDLILSGARIDRHMTLGDGSVISGGLYGNELTVVDSVILSGGSVFDEIRLRSADIGGQLNLSDGSVVTSALDANRVAVADSVFMRESTFADVSFLSADIGGNLDFDNESMVTGELLAEDATIGGSVFMRRGSEFSDVSFTAARIDGRLEVDDGSVVSGEFSAPGAWVTNAIFMRGKSRFADVDLTGAHIGEDLDLNSEATFRTVKLVDAHVGRRLNLGDGSRFSGQLDATGLTVAGSALLRGGSEFTDIRLTNAEIGGQLSLGSGSIVSGTLNGERLIVGENLFLGDGSRLHEVNLIGAEIGGLVDVRSANWSSDGRLYLQFANAGGVAADSRADSWPDAIDLNGFTFDDWARPDPRVLGASWFTDTWLARLGQFSPGPYDNLATVMDAAGHPTIASDIRYSRSHTERLQVPWSRPDRWGRELHRLVLGYGLRPWWAVGWFLAMWLVGFGVLWLHGRLSNVGGTGATAASRRSECPVKLAPPTARSNSLGHEVTVRVRPEQLLPIAPSPRFLRGQRWGVGQAALYSLDRLLPAVALVDADSFTLTPSQETWMRLQQVAGWTLALFIVGWLGSLLASA